VLFTGENLSSVSFLSKVGKLGNPEDLFRCHYDDEAKHEYEERVNETMMEMDAFDDSGESLETTWNQSLIKDLSDAADEFNVGLTSDGESDRVEGMFGGSGICVVDVHNPHVRKTRIRVAGELVKLGDTTTFKTKVMPQGKPAAFGDIAAQETRVDESVRVATEFTEFEWLDEDGNEVDPLTSKATKPIANAVANITTRVTGVNVKLTKYKLNMYAKGGFFKRHVDHPRDAGSTVGTLVVILPTRFEGGMLELDDANVCVDLQHPRYPTACAFRGPVPHEVTKVSHGCRVTLTYTIDLVPSGAIAMPKPKLSIFLRNRLLEAYPGHGQLGVLLGGLYTPEAIAQYGTQCLTDDKDTRLCNFIMHTLGFEKARVIPVVVDFEGSAEDRDADTRGCYDGDVFQLSLRRWDQLCRGESSDTADKSEFLEESTTFLWPYGCDGESTLWKHRSPSFAGNESEPGSLRCIHFQAALVFSLSDKLVELGKRKASIDSDDEDGDDKRQRTAAAE